ncbi:ThiF family adenylyltransferase [Litorihabitans aurantiacus]|uniref:THIF-type NAD/FAD binding fold domain-containing protein n=1 Tax=Litorihabitans aurantiacus TaxID=1930061 RepID=A0AA37XFZ9_9MICO|nr:ThiF family adenylyltransferase [Litorihabitans aurantiacus]GMA32120.1 hypothetical protein GCM10025875_21120 [Litorihabitans aurantiacus]
MQLIDGVIGLWRREGEVQLGADPRLAVVLEGLSPAQQRALDVLGRQRVGSTAQLARLARGSVRETRALLERLWRAHVLEEPPRGLASVTRAPTVSPLRRLARRDDAERRQRQAASVAVVGGDALGLAIARLLVQSGVGTVGVVDDGPVLAGDVGVLGYRTGDVDQRREVAAVAHLRHARADVRVRVPDRPDVVVLVENRVALPLRSAGLVTGDVPHLSVVRRELDVVVGPAVRPGRDACLRCLDLHRRDADACWPAIATQLAVAPRPHLEPGALVTAAGVACSTVAVMIDDPDGDGGGAPWAVSAEVGAGEVARRRWAPHPECGCGAQDGAPAGS